MDGTQPGEGGDGGVHNDAQIDEENGQLKEQNQSQYDNSIM